MLQAEIYTFHLTVHWKQLCAIKGTRFCRKRQWYGNVMRKNAIKCITGYIYELADSLCFLMLVPPLGDFGAPMALWNNVKKETKFILLSFDKDIDIYLSTCLIDFIHHNTTQT